MVVTIFIWVALYDRVIIPLASKLRGRISAKRRMGTGLVFNFLHLSILYYLVCSWAYEPAADLVSKVSEENGSNEEALTQLGNMSQVDKASLLSEESGPNEKRVN
ncbi:NRT1/ PTR FAMILY 1.2 [Spatholobus suberectus]|nr:NRT1/ PTR FAMILY 1.2 [Spatholobus suberectus]